MICDKCQALFEEVGDRVQAAGVFAKVSRTDDSLRCWARHVDGKASYMAAVPESHDMVWVSLATPDRWLSESIEANLVHLGDKIEDLLEEELCDQGFEGRLPVQHFRDEQKTYVFRSPVLLPPGEELDGEPMIARVTQVLLAFEACFRQLGQMVPGDAAA
jgi:hypothetical protein